ncbi:MULTISPECIES: DUF3558 domain-containing protein [Rhodococcus erythropolis group]|uniref:DUF3558 domain-containing protein n=1 Tax=Rhodococcus erythropolis group TaxID=2840174 RepID=UPI001BE66D80|nr:MULTISPECIES: DUF3558 domain-containing protein [Rhodococcus erythropolis group]MBT2265138.1 DUF3558 domain-containing protein [Rhodococcus erythropolis]MEA1795948.1 DUF3558 domain-containing protein [Rhodococcus qingshengii]
MKFEGTLKRVRIGLALAGALVLLSGCGSVVTGTPRAEGSYGGSDSQEFANVLQECEAVTDEQIAGAVGADAVGRGFFGAICRWDGIGAAGPIKITFNWFETGTLDHERAAFEHLGYVVAKIDINGSGGYQVRQPADPQSCGVSASAPAGGVFGWWVTEPQGGADPCEAAAKLGALTLNRSI